MTPYEHWLQSHKLNLRAYTEAEIFQFGYDARNEEIDKLNKQIEAYQTIMENVENEPHPPKFKTVKKKNESL